MRLTTKGRFAVTAMADLALHENQGPITLSAIGQRQNMSLSYLEQLFGKLRRNKLVESVRGPGGGYQLARSAENTTVAQIVVAVDEPLDSTQCRGKGYCQGDVHDKMFCMTHELWENLNQKMIEYLDSVSLKDLVERSHSHKHSKASDKPLKIKGIGNQPVDKTVRVNVPNSVFAIAKFNNPRT